MDISSSNLSLYAYSTVAMVNTERSSPVRSSQRDIHPRLQEIVRRHQVTPWKAVLHKPSAAAFLQVARRLEHLAPEGIILDSGCGTGQSTRLIAEAFPQSVVIGIDRSAQRLSRLTGKPWPAENWIHQEANALWVRAELAAFWRLALEAGWQVKRHFLLYPNPWPKPSQFRRRWHGHPVFPDLLALGGQFELRTNWLVYAREFQVAVHCLTGKEPVVESLCESPISTPFEQKYRRSEHELYVIRTDLQSAVRAET